MTNFLVILSEYKVNIIVKTKMAINLYSSNILQTHRFTTGTRTLGSTWKACSGYVKIISEMSAITTSCILQFKRSKRCVLAFYRNF